MAIRVDFVAFSVNHKFLSSLQATNIAPQATNTALHTYFGYQIIEVDFTCS